MRLIKISAKMFFYSFCCNAPISHTDEESAIYYIVPCFFLYLYEAARRSLC